MFEMIDLLDAGSGDSNSGDTDFLNAPIFAGRIPVKLVELEAGEIDPRYLRTSYSSNLLQHACPRKFQLKCLGAQREPDELSNITFAFGHIVGDGLQNILLGKPWEEVVFKAYLGWHADLFAANEKQSKDFFKALYCLQQFNSLVEGGFLDEYEVAFFEGKPAAELSFRIHFPNSTFRGFVDLVLRHKITGELVVLELKTTSANYIRASSYKNSAQAIGYSVVLDKIEPDNTSYGVIYLCYLTKGQKFEIFEFPKTYHQRSLWIRDRLNDESEIVKLAQEEGNYGIWPMHGESCYSFGRDCEYMDSCHLSTENQMVSLNEEHYKDINRDTKEEATYQFEIQLSELLEAQERLSEGEVTWQS